MQQMQGAAIHTTDDSPIPPPPCPLSAHLLPFPPSAHLLPTFYPPSAPLAEGADHAVVAFLTSSNLMMIVLAGMSLALWQVGCLEAA
jgi:hypothetical protein